jgi:hypothetical protein
VEGFPRGGSPVLGRDGEEIFYIANDRKLMVTAVKAGSPIRDGNAEAAL